MSTRIEGDAVDEWRQHWKVVLAAFAGMGVASVISYSSSLFIEPLEQEFGWSRAQIMSGHSIAATIAAKSPWFPFLCCCCICTAIAIASTWLASLQVIRGGKTNSATIKIKMV